MDKCPTVMKGPVLTIEKSARASVPNPNKSTKVLRRRPTRRSQIVALVTEGKGGGGSVQWQLTPHSDRSFATSSIDLAIGAGIS